MKNWIFRRCILDVLKEGWIYVYFFVFNMCRFWGFKVIYVYFRLSNFMSF